MRGNVGKRDSLVKAKVAELRDQFDALINPLTGGQSSQDPMPSIESENLSRELHALIRDAFDAVYQT